MKKYLYPLLAMFGGATVFALLGFLKFVGVSHCDETGFACDCFCCHMFGLRGYEACGDFGLLAGAIVGAAIGLVTYMFLMKK